MTRNSTDMGLECARRKGKTVGWIGSLLIQDELTVSWADHLLTEQADILLYSCLFKFLFSNDRALDVSGRSHQASIFACFKSQLESSQVGDGNKAESHKQSPCVAPSAFRQVTAANTTLHRAMKYKPSYTAAADGSQVQSKQPFRKPPIDATRRFEEQVQVTQEGSNRRPGPSQAFRTRGARNGIRKRHFFAGSDRTERKAQVCSVGGSSGMLTRSRPFIECDPKGGR
jgi:hypothetical protein